MKLGGNFSGCRIGFDLGGSDRKCAAVIDGKAVHSEEVVWDPYFQKDPWPPHLCHAEQEAIRKAIQENLSFFASLRASAHTGVAIPYFDHWDVIS